MSDKLPTLTPSQRRLLRFIYTCRYFTVDGTWVNSSSKTWSFYYKRGTQRLGVKRRLRVSTFRPLLKLEVVKLSLRVDRTHYVLMTPLGREVLGV